MTVSKAVSECLASLGTSAVPPCPFPALAEHPEGSQMRFECVSYRNTELIEATVPVSTADRLSCTPSIGGRHRVIPSRPVDELLDDSLPVLGQTAVIESEDVNRRPGSGVIADYCNLAIEIESKATFASRLKRGHEFGAIVLPPAVLFLCSVAIRRLHSVPRETRNQVAVVEV